MQSIPIPKINRRHTDSLPSVVSRIVLLNFVDPVFAHILRYVLAEADVDEEVGVFFAGLEVGRGNLAAELLFDGFAWVVLDLSMGRATGGRAEKIGCLPASQRTSALRLVV